MKLIFLSLLCVMTMALTLVQAASCPEEICYHTAKFWQTYNCFSDPAINWSPGKEASNPPGSSFSKAIGLAGMKNCDLRSTIPEIGNQIIGPPCLANFQGADMVLQDLSTSTNKTALMLQEYYNLMINYMFNNQALIGECPVGPDGFPSGVPVAKRYSLMELLIISFITNKIDTIFVPVANLAGPNCDFSLVDPDGPEVTSALAQINVVKSQTLQCVEFFDDDGDCSPTDGCTHSQGFWKTHVPWLGDATNAEDTELCGISWINWLQLKNKDLPEFGNAQRILARQWIAAKVNELSGACVPATVDLFLAERTLVDNCAFTIESSNSVEGQLMVNLAAAISEFNLGYVGPGSCDVSV